MTLDEQFSYLTKGCVDVVRADELRKKLERSSQTGKPLVVKVGFDPTAPDLHLGHTVLIRKMKHFQDLGHTVIFLIGDFTGLIGDPTGRSKTRPPLTRDEIDQNAETYKTQVFKLLDPQKTVIDFNSRWLVELGSEGWVRLAARYNVAQMLERRDFKQRYEKGQPIAIHEFLYPLAQAYDSVRLKADVELGGTDQLFNLNVGRDIMPGYGLEPQIVMTTPLLVGLDGVEKMSKSAGNYVGIMEPPFEMFGKLMSISDELMKEYYRLLTDLSEDAIKVLTAADPNLPLEGLGRAGPSNVIASRPSEAVIDAALQGLKEATRKDEPRDVNRAVIHAALRGLREAMGLDSAMRSTADEARRATQMDTKLVLAELIVKDFHGPDAAAGAREEFERRFARKELPKDLDERRVPLEVEGRRLSNLIADVGLADSSSAAMRLLDQGAVRIDGERITDRSCRVYPDRPPFVLQVGRKALRLTPEPAAKS